MPDPRHQISNRAQDQYLARARRRCYPGTDVRGDPSQFPACQLAFPGMQARADLQPDGRDRVVTWLARWVIARCSNQCYGAFMSSQPEITQRDLRMRSKEIMDAVERGQAFTVTRDGHSIGELVPLRQRRRFVTRAEFAAMSRTAPVIDADAFQADQDAAADQVGSAYGR